MNRRIQIALALTVIAVVVLLVANLRWRDSDPAARLLASTAAGTSRTAVSAAVLKPGELAAFIAAYQSLPAALDRSNYDVSARAKAIGPDPGASLTFVRDGLADEIYPGLLRGSQGTLQAGAGNSADKSVLLAALLSFHGHQARFAHCTLEAAEGSRRIQALFGRPDQRRRGGDLESALRAALLKNGMTGDRADELLNAWRSARASLDNAVLQTARADLQTVQGVLAQANLVPQPQIDPRILEDARDHYWVQLKRTDGWEDMDPAIPAADRSSRKTLCKPERTFAEIPAGAFQTVSLSLRNEYIEGDKLRSETILTGRFKVQDLYGQVLHLANVGSATPGALLTAGKLEQFVPFVETAAGVIDGHQFTAVTKPAAADAIADAFGGGGDDGPVLGAQWIDFVMDAPGRRTTTSRALIDLVKPEERSSGTISTRPSAADVTLALTQTWAIAITAGVIDPAMAIQVAYRDLDAKNAGRAFDMPSDKDAGDDALRAARFQSEQPLLAVTALSYASVAERTLAAHAAASDKVRLIRDQPMVTIAGLGLRRRADGQSTVSELAIDLRHDQIRVVAQSPAGAIDAFWANALHGLVDGALEHHLPELDVRAEHDPPPAPAQFDTTMSFRLAREQGIEIRAEEGPAASQKLLIAPVQPVDVSGEPRSAMWSIDRRTGALISILDTGLHGQTHERSKLERLVNFLENQVRRCVQNRTNMAVCRQMFQMWAETANELREAAGLIGRINMASGVFRGFIF